MSGSSGARRGSGQRRWGRGSSRFRRAAMSATAPLVLVVLAIAAVGCSSVAPTSPAVSSLAPTSQGPALSPSATSSEGPTPSPIPSSSAASPGSGEAIIDACALVSAAELSKIVGGQPPVGRAIPGAGWVTGQCAWSSPIAAFLISVGTSASIQSVGDPAVQDAKDKLAEFQQRMAAAGSPRPVSGIGDGAIVAKAGMAAYKGPIYLEVTNLRLTEDQMIEVVKLVVARL